MHVKNELTYNRTIISTHLSWCTTNAAHGGREQQQNDGNFHFSKWSQDIHVGIYILCISLSISQQSTMGKNVADSPLHSVEKNCGISIECRTFYTTFLAQLTETGCRRQYGQRAERLEPTAEWQHPIQNEVGCVFLYAAVAPYFK